MDLTPESRARRGQRQGDPSPTQHEPDTRSATALVLEDSTSGENALSHRVFVGRAEIGAAWSKCSNENRDYLSLKLDDPSFTQPIYANFFDDTVVEGGEETFSLIWSRARRKNGD